ncbi:MAG: hypothetical protein WD078_09245 [Woeseia sp.]
MQLDTVKWDEGTHIATNFLCLIEPHGDNDVVVCVVLEVVPVIDRIGTRPPVPEHQIDRSKYV